jgi:LPXTG cell wall anchor motif
MNRSIKNLFHRSAIAAFVTLIVVIGSWAQDTTITTTQKGLPSYETEVKNAEVVYVEGNDLVLKLEDGRVEHLVGPDSDEFTIDGKAVSVHELRAGTRLTQAVTTSTTPHFVNTVRTLEGKVWHVNPPNFVILRLPDNTNQMYTIPNHAKFTINGQEKTAFDLRKGMNITATIVTDEEHTVIDRSKFAFGQAPKPETPREVGVLLFRVPQQPETTLASAETPADELPSTGTRMPLVGFVGVFALATALGLRTARRKFAL